MSKQLSVRTKARLDRLLENTGDTALKRRARRIVEELNPEDGDRILDLGCGNGYYLFLLSRLGLKLKLTGCDYDKVALKYARNYLKNRKVKLVYGDLMRRLPFNNMSFDKIVMSEVLEHLPDELKGLKEIKRVLKREGTLIITVPNHHYPFLWDPVNWLLEHFLGMHIESGFWAGIWNQHERLYKSEELKNVIDKVGFQIEKCESLTFWCLPFNHYIVNLGARILARDRSNQFLKGSDKFSEEHKKGMIAKMYFGLASRIDRLNDKYAPNAVGVSLFMKVTK